MTHRGNTEPASRAEHRAPADFAASPVAPSLPATFLDGTPSSASRVDVPGEGDVQVTADAPEARRRDHVEDATAAPLDPARPGERTTFDHDGPKAAAPIASPRQDAGLERAGDARKRQEVVERGVNRMTARNAVIASVHTPELGHVLVDAHRRGQAVDVSIVVDHADAVIAIEGARSELERELRQDGVRVSSLDVRTSGAPSTGSGEGHRSPSQRGDSSPDGREASAASARTEPHPSGNLPPAGGRVRIVL